MSKTFIKTDGSVTYVSDDDVFEKEAFDIEEHERMNRTGGASDQPSTLRCLNRSSLNKLKQSPFPLLISLITSKLN